VAELAEAVAELAEAEAELAEARAGRVIAAAVDAVATVNAPLAMRAMSLDRLLWTFRCRDKGTLRFRVSRVVSSPLIEDCLEAGSARGRGAGQGAG
jgi:hypothetical protein